jgi:DNA invertase Pin-like site-specific DNA recombinase
MNRNEKRAKALDMFCKGATRNEIAAAIGLTPCWVSHFLPKGLSFPPSRKIKPQEPLKPSNPVFVDEEETRFSRYCEIAQMYQAGYSLKEIRLKSKVSVATIYKACKVLSVPLRRNNVH